MKKRNKHFVFLLGRRWKKVEQIFRILAVFVRTVAQFVHLLTMILSHC